MYLPHMQSALALFSKTYILVTNSAVTSRPRNFEYTLPMLKSYATVSSATNLCLRVAYFVDFTPFLVLFLPFRRVRSSQITPLRHSVCDVLRPLHEAYDTYCGSWLCRLTSKSSVSVSSAACSGKSANLSIACVAVVWLLNLDVSCALVYSTDTACPSKKSSRFYSPTSLSG